MPYTPKDGDADIIATALKRFALAADAERDQRKRELEDLSFEFDPWPAEAKTARAGYMYAGETVPARPMLNIPMLDQPLQLVINQEKAAHLGISVHPETEDADDETAEIDQGIIRHIEVRSRANLARSWAFERAIRCGRGYYEVRKRYARVNATGPEASDQELYVARILNQASVYDDPWAVEPDKSDRLWAFKIEDLPHERYAQAVGKQGDLAGLTAKEREAKYAELTNNGAIFGSIGDDVPGWVTDTYCRIAEYWTVETTTKPVKIGRLRAGHRTAESHLAEDQRRRSPRRSRMGRHLHSARLRAGPRIQHQRQADLDRADQQVERLRPVGELRRISDRRESRDRHQSGVHGRGGAGGRPRSRVRARLGAAGAVRALQAHVPRRRVESAAAAQSGRSRPSADVQLLQQAKEFVHGATATFDPSLGNVSPKDRSGKAIVAQQQQSDASNSDFIDNLGEISMTYEARVLLDLIPKVYDRPGRLQEVINGKDERRKIILNQPFYADPKTQEAPSRCR
jgi:hypothetical protein